MKLFSKIIKNILHSLLYLHRYAFLVLAHIRYVLHVTSTLRNKLSLVANEKSILVPTLSAFTVATHRPTISLSYVNDQTSDRQV